MSANSRARHRDRIAYFKYLEETAIPVDNYVQDFFTKRLCETPQLLELTTARYRAGKPKLRPAQVRWSYELVSGREWNSIIPMCAAVEVKDTAYYCLDEMFDKSGDARVLPVLSGVLLTLASDMAAAITNTVPHERFAQAMSELCRLDYHIAQGSLVEMHMRNANEQQYLQKASNYNYWQHTLKIGAILGEGDERAVRSLEEIGKRIGTAYIIANDTYEYGKERLEDLPAGICTLPVAYALEHTAAGDRAVLESFFGKGDLSTDEEDQVRRIMLRSGAIEYGKSKARELCDSALKLLAKFPDAQPRRMIEFSTTMTQRNKYFSALDQLQER
jgi:geranylgeranyl pyrophosphate synthase